MTRSRMGYIGARVFVLGAALVVAFGASGCKKKHPPADAGATARADEGPRRPRETPDERTAPVTIVAPAPLPEGLPLRAHVSTTGRGPSEYVDRAAIRSLLYFKKYAQLDAAFATLQQRFEKNPLEEPLVDAAYGSFESSEDGLRSQLDGWVAAAPESFAALLSRSTHFTSVGWDARGTGFAGETSAQAFAKMREAHALAAKDAEKALALHPKLQAAHVVRVRIAEKEADRKALLDRAVKDCPTCASARWYYAKHLEPRWGGTYELLDAFAKSLDAAKNPRFARFAGFSDLDRALVALHAKKYDDALALVASAEKRAGGVSFDALRADILSSKSDDAGALAAIDRDIDTFPGRPDAHIRRATILSGLARWKEAGEELLDGLRVDRTNATARAVYRHVIDWLVWQGWQDHLAGKKDLALDQLEVALELAPTDQVAAGTLAAIVVAGNDPNKDLPRLEAQIKAKPDDFRAHRELDYALATLSRFKDVVAMWDGYIARHPSDGRAHLERGGAKNRLGDRAGSQADARAACNLGISQGCIFAERASR